MNQPAASLVAESQRLLSLLSCALGHGAGQGRQQEVRPGKAIEGDDGDVVGDRHACGSE
jgi:hypothetical protein